MIKDQKQALKIFDKKTPYILLSANQIFKSRDFGPQGKSSPNRRGQH